MIYFNYNKKETIKLLGSEKMTIRHMTIFLEVYKTRNMTAAAKNLYMTQPSVSQAIRELENNYQHKFFERLSQKLYLTEEGELFYKYASEIIRLNSEVKERLLEEKDSKLSIGGNYTMGIHMLNSYIDAYRKENPNIKIYVTINKASYLKQQLRDNKLDFALIEELKEDCNDFVQIPFYKDKVVAVVSPDYAINKDVMLADIAGEPFLTREKGVGARELFEKKMIQNDFIFYPTWESISATALINACKKKEGIAILPYEAVKELIESQELIELKIGDIDLSRNLVICYHKDKYVKKEMKEFIELICRKGGEEKDVN